MSLTRINTNVEAMFTRTALQRIETSMNRSMTRISTGLRLNTAADDPSAIGMYNTFRAELSGTRVAIQNSEESISMMNTANTYMNLIMDNLIASRDLAIRAANEATLDTATRSALNSEYQQLRTNVQSMTSVDFNGVNLLDGAAPAGLAAAAGLNVQCGPDSGDTLTLQLTNGLNGTQVGGQAWAQATINANSTAALTAITQLDDIIEAWSGEIASLGAQMNLVQFKLDELQSREVNVSSVISTVGDADLAAEISEYTRLQIMSNAAVAMMAQANVQSANLIQSLLQ